MSTAHTTTINLSQGVNDITAYGYPTGTLSYPMAPASGGAISPSLSVSQVRQYTSGATDSITPSATVVYGANILNNSGNSASSTAYGFNWFSANLDVGMHTMTVSGRCSEQAIAEGHRLVVYLYNSSWSVAPSVSISATTDAVAQVAFNIPTAGRYDIGCYLSPSGGTRTGAVTVNWITLFKGNSAPQVWSPSLSDLGASINASTGGVTFDNNMSATAKSLVVQAAFLANGKNGTAYATATQAAGAIVYTGYEFSVTASDTLVPASSDLITPIFAGSSVKRKYKWNNTGSELYDSVTNPNFTWTTTSGTLNPSTGPAAALSYGTNLTSNTKAITVTATYEGVSVSETIAEQAWRGTVTYYTPYDTEDYVVVRNGASGSIIKIMGKSAQAALPANYDVQMATVNGMGGVNKLANSSGLNGSKGWFTSSSLVTSLSAITTGLPTGAVSGMSFTTTGYGGIYQPTILTSGTRYTASAWVKSSVAGVVVQFGLGLSGTYVDAKIAVADTWYFVTWSFIYTPNSFVVYSRSATTLSVANIMLNEGDTPLPYVPNANDALCFDSQYHVVGYWFKGTLPNVYNDLVAIPDEWTYTTGNAGSAAVTMGVKMGKPTTSLAPNPSTMAFASSELIGAQKAFYPIPSQDGVYIYPRWDSNYPSAVSLQESGLADSLPAASVGASSTLFIGRNLGGTFSGNMVLRSKVQGGELQDMATINITGA